jgi:hypothetical protein
MIDKSIQYFEEGGAAVDDWQPPAAMDRKALDAYQKLVDQGSDPFAARALLTAVGLLPYDKRYDLQGRGTVTANDALQFQKYADGVETEYDDAIKKTYAGYRLPREIFNRPPELTPIPPGGDFGLPPPNDPIFSPPELSPLPPGDRLPRDFLEGGPAILPPGGGELMPIPPGGPVQPSPPVVAPPPVYGGPVQPRPPVNPPPVYGGPVQPRPPVNPPPVYGGPVPPSPPVNPPPVFGGPVQPSPPFYQPPAITTPAAGETRAQGYNATLDRFANSPFARPQGIESLRLGGLEL